MIMSFELSDLIERLQLAQEEKIGMDIVGFTRALYDGIRHEPEQFCRVVDEYEALLRRVRPDISPELRRAHLVTIMSMYAFLADCRYNPYDPTQKRLRSTSLSEGYREALDYFSQPDKYGLVMKAFSDYLQKRNDFPRYILLFVPIQRRKPFSS